MRSHGDAICKVGSINGVATIDHHFKGLAQIWRITWMESLNYCRTKVASEWGKPQKATFKAFFEGAAAYKKYRLLVKGASAAHGGHKTEFLVLRESGLKCEPIQFL